MMEVERPESTRRN